MVASLKNHLHIPMLLGMSCVYISKKIDQQFFAAKRKRDAGQNPGTTNIPFPLSTAGDKKVQHNFTGQFKNVCDVPSLGLESSISDVDLTLHLNDFSRPVKTIKCCQIKILNMSTFVKMGSINVSGLLKKSSLFTTICTSLLYVYYRYITKSHFDVFFVFFFRIHVNL